MGAMKQLSLMPLKEGEFAERPTPEQVREWTRAHEVAVAEERARRKEAKRERKREYHRRWYGKNAEKKRAKSRRRYSENSYREYTWARGGVNEAIYSVYVATATWMQKGACICGAKLTKSSALDHDHRTGHARGVLCDDCNTTLGKLEKLGITMPPEFQAYLDDPPYQRALACYRQCTEDDDEA